MEESGINSIPMELRILGQFPKLFAFKLTAFTLSMKNIPKAWLVIHRVTMLEFNNSSTYVSIQNDFLKKCIV